MSTANERYPSILLLALVLASWSAAVRSDSPPAQPAPTSTLEILLSGSTPPAAGPVLQPLWRSDDGLFELSLRDGGTLRLHGATRPLPDSPLPRPLVGSPDVWLQIPLDASLRFGVSAGLDFGHAAPCRMVLGSSICLDRSMDAAPDLQRGRVGAGVAGHDWSVDISYAETWLDHTSWLAAPESIGQAPLWRGQELGLSSRFGAVGGDQMMFGLSFAHWRGHPGPWAALDAYDSATFSIGLSRGALSGEIASRLVHSDHALGQPQYWAGLDLGLSWRMPWHGEIQFGARNLVTRSQLPASTAAPSAMDEVRARTPYVRYHQDF